MQQIPQELADYARRQFGLVTRAQALQCLSSQAIYRRLGTGVLVRENRGVYRLAGSERSWRQRALGACLAAGDSAVLSHLSAAYLWRAPSLAAPRPQLTVPRGRRCGIVDPPPHRLPLPPLDVTERWSIPTTTPVRTVIDLSTVVARPLLERVMDDLIRTRQLRIEEVLQRLGSAEPLPRHRSELLRKIVELRRVRGTGASPKEDWVVDTLLAAGLEMPVRNVIIEAGGRLFEVDVAYPDLKIGIE